MLGKIKVGPDSDASGFDDEPELDQSGKNVTAYLRMKFVTAGPGYTPGPPGELTFELERDTGKEHGLDLNIEDGPYALVNGVMAGIFQEYNENAKIGAQPKSGDFIA